VSTAIITANLPLTWTLLQRIFGLSSFYSSKYGKSSGQRTGDVTGGAGNRFRSAYGNLTSRTREEREARKPDPYHIDISPTSSQEQINGGIPLKIWQQHEVRVTTQDLGSGGGASSPTAHHGTETAIFTVNNSPPSSLNGDSSVKETEMGVVTKVSRGL
jgi:hypothetical protein